MDPNFNDFEVPASGDSDSSDRQASSSNSNTDNSLDTDDSAMAVDSTSNINEVSNNPGTEDTEGACASTSSSNVTNNNPGTEDTEGACASTSSSNVTNNNPDTEETAGPSASASAPTNRTRPSSRFASSLQNREEDAGWFCSLRHKTSAELYTRWFACDQMHRICGGCRQTQKGLCYICSMLRQNPLIWTKSPEDTFKVRLSKCPHAGCNRHCLEDEEVQHRNECILRPLQCFETCGNRRCLGDPIPIRDFNQHLQTDHRVIVPPSTGNQQWNSYFVEELRLDILQNAGYAHRFEPIYMWLTGRLFLRTMIYFSEYVFIALNPAEGPEEEANRLTMVVTVNKNNSNWERRWVRPMSSISNCFGRFVSHPATVPLGAISFSVDFGQDQCDYYRIRYELPSQRVLNQHTRIRRDSTGSVIRKYFPMNPATPATSSRRYGGDQNQEWLGLTRPFNVFSGPTSSGPSTSRERLFPDARLGRFSAQNAFNLQLERARELMNGFHLQNRVANDREQNQSRHENLENSSSD